jgi:hypothetical protein
MQLHAQTPADVQHRLEAPHRQLFVQVLGSQLPPEDPDDPDEPDDPDDDPVQLPELHV